MVTKDNKLFYTATLEDGTEVIVTMEVISSEDMYKPYGIKAYMTDKDGTLLDSSSAENFFATAGEAVRIMEMLCDCTVFPSTLTDCL